MYPDSPTENHEENHGDESALFPEENSESMEVENKLDTSNNSVGKQKLQLWLNRFLKIKMTDGRTLIGAFLCTDRDANIILGVCSEYLYDSSDARTLGLVMVPGRHIVSIQLDV